MKWRAKNNPARAIVIVSVVSIVIFSYIYITFAFSPMVITTGSMEPTLNIGDVVLIDRHPVINNIRTGPDGDIIVLKSDQIFLNAGVPASVYAVNDPNAPVIHRAIQRIEINGTMFFVTKGDNNQYADGCVRYIGTPNASFAIIIYNASNPVLVPSDYIFGKVVLVIPFIGLVKIYFPFLLIDFAIVAFGLLYYKFIIKRRS
jgi:signal peptidase I